MTDTGKYQVRVLNTNRRNQSLLKSLRQTATLNIKDAEQLKQHIQDFAPCVLVAGVDMDIAEHVKMLLANAGVVAEIEQSPMKSPMLLCPNVEKKYAWNGLLGPVPVD